MPSNIVLFAGTNASGRTSLWETDGTAAGTHELTGIAGASGSGLGVSLDLTVSNGEALFIGYDASGFPGLWETNGTVAGTHELNGAVAPLDLAAYGDEVLFAGQDASVHYNLWETDGTAAGTHELTGIAGADATGVTPSGFTVYGDEVLFNGQDASGDFGLWVTNGTAAGTHELTGVAGASASGLKPGNMTVYDGEVLFDGVDAGGFSGLWVTNGTAASTHEVTGILGTGSSSFYPEYLTVYNGEVLFDAAIASAQDGLWVTNGTAAGTHELTGIAGARSVGLGLGPTDLTVYNDKVLFAGFDASGQVGLWETDGTAAGTHELTGIAGAYDTGFGLDPTDLTVYDGEVLFAGVDASLGEGLWVTNGTAAGTHELTGIAGSDPPPTGLFPTDLTPFTPLPTWAVTSTLNDFSFAQGWGSPDNPREVVETATDPSGGADYVGFGANSVIMAFGESTPSGPTFANPIAAVHDFGTAEGYTSAAQRGAADTGDTIAPTVYGQGFAGLYWYDATGGTGTNPTYQSSPNLYPDFGTHEGWTPANGFDVVKAQSSDPYASILGFGAAGIVVGPQAFDPIGTPAPSYVIPFAAGNNSGWDQTRDIRSFIDNNGDAIDLNGDGITDFVGMGPSGLEFAFGAESGGKYALGPLQTAQINGSNPDFGEAQGWNDATTVRDIVKDPTTGDYDIIGFGAAGVYVSMGQDPAAHGGQPFGQKYLALSDFGLNQGWSNAATPRLVGDVNGDGIPDIVGFGANSTFTALGSYNSSGQLIFTMDPSATINDFGYNEGWSVSNTVRTLANVDGGGDSLVVSGAFNTQTLKLG